MQHTHGHASQNARQVRRLRLPRILRSVSPAAVAVIVSLLIGGAGFADAATGGNFILGKANTETTTATMTNSKGTPLALSAPAGKPPLTVNRNTMVSNLNANYLGGMTETGLAVTGGAGFTPGGHDTPINDTPAAVASTGTLPAGTYYVSATARLQIASGDSEGVCYIARGSSASTDSLTDNFAGEPGGTVAETAAVRVNAGDTIQEVCYTLASNGSNAYSAGIIAIRVLSSHQ